MKYLIKKSNDGGAFTDGVYDNPSVRGIGLVSPPYGSLDSYTSYINQNPNNKYIKRLKKNQPNTIKTLKDVGDEYLQNDNFTFRPNK